MVEGSGSYAQWKLTISRLWKTNSLLPRNKTPCVYDNIKCIIGVVRLSVRKLSESSFGLSENKQQSSDISGLVPGSLALCYVRIFRILERLRGSG